MDRPNLYRDVPEIIKDELFQPLIETDHFRLEKIVSRGHSTPPGEWCDQDREEWVVLLKGRAGLLFEGETEVRVMGPGDWLRIPGRRRHRVEWTDTAGETIWLALHYRGARDKSDEAGL